MRATLLIVAFGLAACGNGAENAAFVNGLRLLGARSEPPEAAPGDAVTLTAWAVDPTGHAVDLDWSACTAPPVAGTGELNPSCITTDAGAPLDALGSGASLAVTVPSYGALGPPDITGGVYLPFRIHLATSVAALDGVYRLRAPDGQPSNHNPTLAGLFVVTDADAGAAGGTALDESTPYPVHSGDTLTLVASFTADSVESYTVMLPGAPPRPTSETLSVVWFSTAGRLRHETTGADVAQTFRLDRDLPPSGSLIDLWIVGLDERGGADLAHRTLLLQ
ncbi:MAG TPA: hypothetical protein VGH63_09105 [Polyangia bacterium]